MKKRSKPHIILSSVVFCTGVGLLVFYFSEGQLNFVLVMFFSLVVGIGIGAAWPFSHPKVLIKRLFDLF